MEGRKEGEGLFGYGRARVFVGEEMNVKGGLTFYISQYVEFFGRKFSPKKPNTLMGC